MNAIVDQEKVEILSLFSGPPPLPPPDEQGPTGGLEQVWGPGSPPGCCRSYSEKGRGHCGFGLFGSQCSM